MRAFSLLEKGYALGGTIHARTAEETIYVLNKWMGIPLEMISQLGAIVMLKARAGREYNDEPIRRVNSVNLIIKHARRFGHSGNSRSAANRKGL